jgi:hypothetical protein
MPVSVSTLEPPVTADPDQGPGQTEIPGDEAPADAPEPQADGGLVAPGSSSQLSFDIGGKAPTSATLTLTGGKIEIEGQFEKGEIVDLHIQARVNDVGFKDQEDSKTGQVVGCERRQKARIIGVERINA